jgi:hypothetical protein
MHRAEESSYQSSHFNAHSMPFKGGRKPLPATGLSNGTLLVVYLRVLIP